MSKCKHVWAADHFYNHETWNGEMICCICGAKAILDENKNPSIELRKESDAYRNRK